MKEFTIDLSGEWRVRLQDGTEAKACLPGTLDENGIGGPDRPEKQWHSEITTGRAEDDFFGENPISTRFTRKHTYTGPAEFTREITLDALPEGCRWIITAERSRKLSLRVNGEAAEPVTPGTLSTPWRFETRALRAGKNELRFVSDNSYPGWPAEAILYSSAATDETQTNWNGILGEIRLEAKPEVFLTGARLVCDPEMKTAELQADICGSPEAAGAEMEIRFVCHALKDEVGTWTLRAPEGTQTVRLPGLRLRWTGLQRWSPQHPRLYALKLAVFVRRPGRTLGRDELSVPVGVRSFEPDARHRLSLNGKRIFLRSEANCAAWPETGHPPMDAGTWKGILKRYQAYGVNCVRFHSHCPPEAAFTAADEVGMLMQPELSHWDPEHAFEDDISFDYYRTELREIQRALGHHPSFVMLTLGNELACDEKGQERMETLVREARNFLPDRLYARGSNAFYGAKGCDPESDFYTAQNFGKHQMRAISAAGDSEHPTEKVRIKGYLNNLYPSAKMNYSEGMAAMRERVSQPMFSFEVGQYEVLPDFHELEQFRGVTEPVNYRIIQRRAERKGLLHIWDRMTEASGELALIGYREEAEAVLRTPAMSGISLLSLQDFPGQGTALVGMMNAHLQPKSFDFARPERFEAFFRDAMPLPELERYTYFAGETLRADIRAVNYGQRAISGTLVMEMHDADGSCLERREWPGFRAPAGESAITAAAEIPLPRMERAAVLRIELFLKERSKRFRSERRIWVYPEEPEEAFGEVLAARKLTGETLKQLEAGARVLLEPTSDKTSFPEGIFGQFTTDFWSVGTFPQQEGGMGLLIDAAHPVFREFPTSFHTDYQWWLMAGQRAAQLPDERLADGMIVRQMDSYAQLRTLAMLMEFRVGKGRLLISTMGLKDLPQKPEVRALRNALIRYTKSEAFEPKVSVTAAELTQLFPGCMQ